MWNKIKHFVFSVAYGMLIFGEMAAPLKSEEYSAIEFEVEVSSEMELEAWEFHFATPEEFWEALKSKDKVRILAGVQNRAFYMLFQRKEDNALYLVFLPEEGGRFERSSGRVRLSDQNDAYWSVHAVPILIANVTWKMEPTIMESVVPAGTEYRQETRVRPRTLMGQAIVVPKDYEGPINIVWSLWAKEDDAPRRVSVEFPYQ